MNLLAILEISSGNIWKTGFRRCLRNDWSVPYYGNVVIESPTYCREDIEENRVMDSELVGLEGGSGGVQGSAGDPQLTQLL